MLTQHAAIDIVRNYAREIAAQGVHLRMVIVYGSFARGGQHEWSDIDVALVADEFTGLPGDFDLFASVGVKKPYRRIELRTYPTDYFRRSDPFIEEIHKEGIVVFRRAEEAE
jgi:predicted nucleotidyltransferase